MKAASPVSEAGRMTVPVYDGDSELGVARAVPVLPARGLGRLEQDRYLGPDHERDVELVLDQRI